MSDSLGDRMKRYEQTSRAMLVPNMPVAIRVDGKAFHTWTRGIENDINSPFSPTLMDAMDNAGYMLASQVDGFVAAYVQSDEVTVIIDDSFKPETLGWFGYNHSKIVSIAASIMTAEFNRSITNRTNTPALFDARAFNIPKDDVINCLLWRVKDWHRNSLQMYARHFFSHKQLHGKSASGLHEMLHHVEKKWATDLTPRQKNGMLVVNRADKVDGRLRKTSCYDFFSTYESLKNVLGLDELYTHKSLK